MGAIPKSLDHHTALLELFISLVLNARPPRATGKADTARAGPMRFLETKSARVTVEGSDVTVPSPMRRFLVRRLVAARNKA